MSVYFLHELSALVRKSTEKQKQKYMKQICKFRQGADIVETVQGLETSIPSAIDYFRIKDTSCPSSYNNQKNLSDVGSRVREPFDVIEYDRSFTRLRKYMKDEVSKDKEKEK